MMTDSMDDPDIEQSPDFRQALKLVLKQEIHFLLKRLSETGEESLVITASLGDGEVTQLGSGKGNEYFQFKKLEELKKDFLSFCRDPDIAAFQKKEKEEIVQQDKHDVMETSISTELPLEMGVMDDTVIKVELNPDCIELERVQISSLVPTDQTVTMETVDEASTDQALNYAAASLNSVTVSKEGTIKQPEEDQQQAEPFSLLNSFSLQQLEQKKDMTHQGHRSDETHVDAGIHVAMETWNEPSQGKKSMIQNLVTSHTKSDMTFVHSLQIKQEEEFMCETEGISNKIVLDFSDMDILPSGSRLDKCGGPQQFSQDKTIPELDHTFVTGSFQSGKILDTQIIPESQETVTGKSSKGQTVDKDQTLWSDYIGGSHHLSATAGNNNITGEPFLETTVKGQSWRKRKMGVEKFRSQSSSNNTKRIHNKEEEICVSEMVTERPQPRLELHGQRSTGSLVSKLSEKPANVPFSRGVSFSLNRSPETHANRQLKASLSLTETVSRDLEVTKTQSGKGVKNSLDMIDLTDEAELQESTQLDSLLQMKNPVSIPTAEKIRRYTEKGCHETVNTFIPWHTR
ncbi:hypothetical protein CHS0354_041193 [Potamilus streckersoni]|uniref:Uncharacterized protein n=1 Tax=Potamilus streckersoni TaxID=2493646 RepID=A0AAE0SDZ4_9BIVA|nr:hypothetical protein CHS0354_041193 [Potamilus streckersoni]